MATVNEKMTALADAIRSKTGLTGTLTLDGMIDAANSIEPASDPVLQSKTVTPSTSFQTVTPDSGYDGLSEVTVNAMPTATQATPTVSIDSAGKITATATQTAGYVSAGTKSGTKQLTTQAAKTITPSTSSQTAVAKGVYTTGVVTVGAIPSTYVKPTATKAATTYTPTTSNQTIAAGTYCSGTQTIKGDSNLKAENIKSGVSIFGVAGSYEGNSGGGGGTDVKIATGSITNATVEFYRNTELFSVSGLGFKPKTLVVHSSMNTSSTLNDTYVYRFSSCYMNDAGEFRCAYLTRGSSTNAGSVYLYNTTSSSVFTLTVNDDGFTVESGPGDSSRYKFYIPKNIYYIAIG